MPFYLNQLKRKKRRQWKHCNNLIVVFCWMVSPLVWLFLNVYWYRAECRDVCYELPLDFLSLFSNTQNMEERCFYWRSFLHWIQILGEPAVPQVVPEPKRQRVNRTGGKRQGTKMTFYFQYLCDLRFTKLYNTVITSKNDWWLQAGNFGKTAKETFQCQAQLHV